jgi:hypothetical protein
MGKGTMIFVRDDDVLIDSSSHKDAFRHFKSIHEQICETPKLLHVPAILVNNVVKDGTKGLAGFPEAVEYIKSETQAGRMRPEIHGYEHVDYAKLDTETVIKHLVECQDFMWKYLEVNTTTWYTPWGANAPHLYEAAAKVDLKLVDCSQIHKLAGRHGVVQRLREGHKIDFLNDQEIFFHWWEGGLRLKRVIEFLKHGSWYEAANANEDWF